MDKDKEITQAIAKKAMKIFIASIVTALVVLICLSFFNKCDRQKDLPIVNDNLTIEQNKNKDSIRIYEAANNVYLKLIDSLLRIKPIIKTKIIHHYTTLHDSIPVFLKDDLDSLQSDWMELDIVNLNTIEYQDSIINNQNKEIKLYKSITHNDTLRINQLNDSIPKAYRLGLKKGRKQGAIFGFIVSGALYVGSKIRP